MPAAVAAAIAQQLATELKARVEQIDAAVALLDGGATVPFIARYRKEATAGLDDVQLRELDTRLAYLRELEARRGAVLASVEDQGKLTPALAAALQAAPTKQELEDLYAPFKPKRRTKGMIAREAGLEPLADALFGDPSLDPLTEASAFVHVEGGFADAPAVLDGVRDLLSERWAEDAALVGRLREWLWAEGQFVSTLAAGFLRIRGGDDPLDASGVHPETYPVVHKMMAATGQSIEALMGRADVLKALKPEAFADARFGAITVKDILTELEKPGRDPRPDFKVARFNDGVSELKDLRPGMLLEGTG